MTTKLRYAVLVMLVSLQACLFHDDPKARLWLFSHSNDKSSRWDSLLTPSSFLELRPDSSYSQDFGHFEYGRWNVKGERLYLTNEQKTTYVYLLKSWTEKELQIMFGKEKTAYFQGLSLPSARLEDDPFSRRNNQWRIPARQKEDMEQIRKRLYDHCHFLEIYFSWVIDKKESIDVSGMPTPLKIYGNGFGLKHYADLPAEWKSYFFDEEDCHKADSLIKRTFRKHDIRWPDTDNRFKKFVSGFQQLQQFLR